LLALVWVWGCVASGSDNGFAESSVLQVDNAVVDVTHYITIVLKKTEVLGTQ